MHSWISFWFKVTVSLKFYLFEHSVFVSEYCEDIRTKLDLQKSLKLVFIKLFICFRYFKFFLQPTLITGGF